MKQIQRLRWLAVILMICVKIICFNGCFDDNPMNSDNNKDTDKLNEDRSFLAVGNQWVYHLTCRIETITYDPPDITVVPFEAEVLWEITAKEQVWGIDAVKMETTHHYYSGPDSGKTEKMLTWFAQTGDTLISVASGPVELYLYSAELHKTSVITNNDEVYPWPVNVLVFPLRVGKEWFFYRGSDNYGKKIVEAVDKVSVPAGDFDAFRITRTLTTNEPEDKSTYCLKQWFSHIGVVQYKEYDEYQCVFRKYDVEGNTIKEWNQKGSTLYTMELVSYRILK